MPYKIVQTKERGKFQLSIIPDKWEQNNVLHWPKGKVETLLEQETSCPDDSWLTMKCQVKRTGLISKHSAEAELSNMLQESDTETEGGTKQITTEKPINVNPVQHYFDDIASTCIIDESTEMPTPLNVGESDNNIQSDNLIYVTNIPQTSEQIVTMQAQNVHSENSEVISNLLAITGALQQNQEIILEYLKSVEDKILRKLSYLSAQFDAFAVRNTKADENIENVKFKVIRNKEDLNSFEQQLEISKFRADIKKQLSCVCGKGKGRGYNNAYSLADEMFSRQFMTQCSWGGGSKTEISKLCFKSYTRTIDLFFALVHESDFTRKDNEIFFKNIMRHSASRNKENIKRAASSKRRPSKVAKISTQPLASPENNISTTNNTNNIVSPIQAAVPASNNKNDKFQPMNSSIIANQHNADDNTNNDEILAGS